MTRAYEEFIDFIVSGPSTAAVAEWRASPATNARVSELIEAEREGTLSDDDRSELNHCLEVEHLVRLAKAKARALVAR